MSRGSAGGEGPQADGDRTELLPRGYRVGGWEVTEPIGSGGWATVYAGRPVDSPPRQPGTGPEPVEVALKFLPTAGLAPRQARKVAETARREVELGRRAGHPRLIRLLDSFVISDPDRAFLDGAIVLVMERAERSLRDLFDAGVAGAAGAAGADVARLFAEICEGLAHLHGSGWVHGDLKPENILLMADGALKLSDFGLATELTGTHGTHGYAPPMGTLDYLPPERWQAPLGEHGVEVRPSADIWALGIMVHEAFASGASPFPGATPVARGAAVQEYADGRAPLRIDSALPPFWRALAADCLAPTHAERAAHSAEILLARIAARSTAPRPVPRRWRSRAALVTVAVCSVAATVWSHAVGDAASASKGQPPARLRVFNADDGCRERTDRNPQCSLGLAIDPLKPYTVDNVVPVRVWHGDVLAVVCRLPRGIPIIDESDASSTEWYRVRLPARSSSASAWLPAVRTADHPRVPDCPRPTGKPVSTSVLTPVPTPVPASVPASMPVR
ncbi:serine/threonine protein kinase [Streptomyces sp. NBC_00825]|uniref:serine/threonine-protein kinase n=1 Tax=unclassified Streptomyces TaxID=2593676 RepID=UPI002ED6BF43|nr:serine/threonine protein kinase [Streptomyces sp. NBC_00826]WTH91406.1 serine/threonine protein kinase [Streptomyces sp. NBC_00825]WTI00134.1 serine/threonine protein kinase [Streptomyces sp. NBC_00822]